jgi:hypothetical protein
VACKMFIITYFCNDSDLVNAGPNWQEHVITRHYVKTANDEKSAVEAALQILINEGHIHFRPEVATIAEVEEIINEVAENFSCSWPAFSLKIFDVDDL